MSRITVDGTRLSDTAFIKLMIELETTDEPMDPVDTLLAQPVSEGLSKDTQRAAESREAPTPRQPRLAADV